MRDATEEDEFHLVDLTGVSLDDLVELDPSVFAHSLRRVLAEIDRPQAAVAGWNSAM